MKQLEEWSRFARQTLDTGEKPHFAVRPEILEMHRRNIIRFTAGISRPSILVLGATPELADLALQSGGKVWRVDINPDMFGAAKPRETVDDRSAETCLHADWQSMDAIAAGSVDVVLGDAALNNVAHTDMGNVLSEIRRVTKPGGILSLKQIVCPDEMSANDKLEQVLLDFREQRISADEFRVLVRFNVFLHQHYDLQSKTLDAARVYQTVDSLAQQGIFNAVERELLLRSSGKIVHTIYSQQQQRRLFADCFGQCILQQPEGKRYYRHIFNVFLVTRQR